MRIFLGFLIASVLCVALPAAFVSAAAAPAHVQTVKRLTAQAGPWRANLTYTERSGFPSISDLHLTVLDGRRLVLDQPVTTKEKSVPELIPGGFARNHTLQFRDLNGDGSPELVLALFTGGAHCCSIEQVFEFAGRTPVKTEKDFADSGATLATINGRTVFRSADDSFAYEFTDYADSGVPVRIWAYSNHRFSDVTLEFRGEIAKDAAFWWRVARPRIKSHGDIRGVLAAWAADEAVLGHASNAKQRLLDLAFAGSLDHGFGAPKGSTYVRALWRFLASQHYLR